MVPDYPPRPGPGIDLGLLRDLLGLLILVVGVAGLAWAAFATDWRLGVAVVSTAAIGVGAYLIYER